MRENVRRCFERHGISILGRSIVTGPLVLGIVGIGAGSAASTQLAEMATAVEGRDDPEHHLHLDPAQPCGRGRHLHGQGERRSQWQPGHLLDRLLGEGKLQHLGRHRHLRRRRDLRHRRQPGRQRQLRGRPPGPAVLRRPRHPDHHLHLDPAQPRGRGRHLHPHGERRGQWQPGHLLDRLLGERKLQHLGCHRHLRRRRDLRHRRQPGRQRQLRGRHPGPAVLRRPRHPDHHLHLDPAQPGGRGRHLHPDGQRRGMATRSPSRSTPRRSGSCSISGATVTFVAVGTCVIDANQAGNASYGPPPRSSSPSIRTLAPRPSPSPRPRPAQRSWEAPTPPRRAAGPVATRSPSRSTPRRMEAAASRVPPSPSSPSGPASSTPTRPATPATRPPPRSSSPSIRSPGTQTITFTSTPPNPAVVGGTYTPTASGGASGNPVTFSIDASAQWSCSISGATVTFVAVGTCVIDANQAGNANYEAAPQVQQSFDRSPAPRASPSPRPRPPGGGGSHLHRPRRAAGPVATRSPSRSTPRRRQLQHLGRHCHLRRRRDLRHRRQPGRQRQLRRPPPRSSSPSPSSAPRRITFTSTPPTPAVVGGTYTVDGERRGQWQPGHLLDRRLGAGQLHHLGCHRQLHRRRDLRHRRQPGRQRQLRGRHPGPAVLRRRRHPDDHLHLDPAQPRGRGRHLHRRRRAAGPVATRSPSRSTPRRRAAAAVSGPPSASPPSGPASSTPTRPATPTTRPPPRSSSPSPSSAPRPSPSPRPRPTRRSVGGTYTATAQRRGQWQPGHLLDRRHRRREAAASRVPPSPSSPSGPASSTPTRPATPTTRPPPRSSSPSPSHPARRQRGRVRAASPSIL